MDAQIGRVIASLADTGRLDDTLILFTSDHGLALGSHGLLGKQNLYEHSMRSPAVIAGPGVPAGKRLDALCYLFDLTATSDSGITAPAHWQSVGKTSMCAVGAETSTPAGSVPGQRQNDGTRVPPR